MFNKHIVLIGIALSLLCLMAASFRYPGGSQKDPHSVGFHWTENYISDMLDYQAVNGEANGARTLAVAGVILMGLTTGLAFVRFARKVGVKKYALVIQYGGVLVFVFNALGTLPGLHDLSVVLGICVGLLVFFYIWVILLHTRFTAFKVLAALFLLSFYGATFIYGSRVWLEYLPLVQKVVHVNEIAWLLGLEYSTKKEDFAHL
jgi:type IV secretory pathway VirB2 component (pilin)